MRPTDLLATLPEARNRFFAQHDGKNPATRVSRHRPRSQRGK
jgi:hypothetical protein